MKLLGLDCDPKLVHEGGELVPVLGLGSHPWLKALHLLIPDVEYLVLFPFLKTAVAQAMRTYHDSLDCQEVVAQLYTIDILLRV